jgi:hypothetical protein
MTLGSEITIALPSLLVALLTLVAGWFVTYRFTYNWAIRQRRRESLLLAATSELYSAYGEFFIAWKLWNSFIDRAEASFDEKRWELLEKAAKAEASTESIVLKIVTELPVSSEEAQALGKFRQAFQSLREAMLDNKKLSWSTSEDPHYIAFKKLSCQVASMLQTRREPKPPCWKKAAENHSVATSNRWEGKWY